MRWVNRQIRKSLHKKKYCLISGACLDFTYGSIGAWRVSWSLAGQGQLNMLIWMAAAFSPMSFEAVG